jgi:hypothetical protein
MDRYRRSEPRLGDISIRPCRFFSFEYFDMLRHLTVPVLIKLSLGEAKSPPHSICGPVKTVHAGPHPKYLVANTGLPTTT